MSKTALTRAERAARGRMEAEATCFGKEMGEMEMMYESAMAQATEARTFSTSTRRRIDR